MDNCIRLILLLVAVLGLPIGYAGLCARMRDGGVLNPPRFAFFFLFGTVGGWVLGLMLSPSGLTAVCGLLMLTAAPLALFVSSLSLAIQNERTGFHRFAMWSGFGYIGILGIASILVKLLG